MINHVVLIKFKAGIKDTDIDELEKILDHLPDKIIEIQTYEFGRDLLRTERSYDFALVALFVASCQGGSTSALSNDLTPARASSSSGSSDIVPGASADGLRVVRELPPPPDTAGGDLVRVLDHPAPGAESGLGSVDWDLKNGAGNLVKPGIYIFHAESPDHLVDTTGRLIIVY